ncbi:MAG: hypothetical protein Q7T13_01570 [Polaromonas sp.]|nr:hypothetical protein [Polaromonas sp.]
MTRAEVGDLIHNFAAEAVRCMYRIDEENATIKELRDAARYELGLDPKVFNALVKEYTRK